MGVESIWYLLPGTHTLGRKDTHLFTIFSETLIGYNPVNFCKQSPILTNTYISTRMDACAALAYQDISRANGFATVAFYPTVLTR